MKAYQLTGHGTPGVHELREVPAAEPGPGEVEVAVRACGLNHLDLWTERGALPVPVALPRTQGCEPSGVVARLGEGVTGLRTGDRVAVQSNLSCGACDYCVEGEDSMCLKGQLLGVQRDGGLAERMVVPARAVVALPDPVGFEASAALSLAASTAMHMVNHRARVRSGDWVLVMAGASGVGSAAIQIARALGGRVISTGSTEAKRRLALELGAEHALDSGRDDWPAEARRISGKRGMDVVVEHVGGDVLGRVFECLARGGTVVTCGATAGREVTMDLWPFFVKQHALIGSYGRNRADLEATLAWAADGRLRPVIDSVHALERCGAAFERLRTRAALGKVLVKVGEPTRQDG